MQGYYKPLFNQARQTLATGAGSDIAIAGNATRYTSNGFGRAYGGEVLLRVRPTRYFVGWVAYSLTRFERDYFSLDPSAPPPLAPGPLDQPHNLIIVGSVKLPWELSLGVRFRYASGPLVTPVLGSLFDTNGNSSCRCRGCRGASACPTSSSSTRASTSASSSMRGRWWSTSTCRTSPTRRTPKRSSTTTTTRSRPT